jgi:predicted RNase H-like nuclease (RuvC/YqgF family)
MARDGNGVDLGTVTAMLTHLVEITEGTRDEMAGMKRDVGELKRDVGDLKRDVGELKRDVGDLKVKVADLDGQVASLRSEVRDYHGTVMGHGILYTELEERVRRIETHLDLPPGSH